MFVFNLFWSKNRKSEQEFEKLSENFFPSKSVLAPKSTSTMLFWAAVSDQRSISCHLKPKSQRLCSVVHHLQFRVNTVAKIEISIFRRGQIFATFKVHICVRAPSTSRDIVVYQTTLCKSVFGALLATCQSGHQATLLVARTPGMSLLNIPENKFWIHKVLH